MTSENLRTAVLLVLSTSTAFQLTAQDKPTKPPEVPKYELLEFKYEAARAQNAALQMESAKAAYFAAEREKLQLEASTELKLQAIYAKAGVKREEWRLDVGSGVFVAIPKPEAKETKETKEKK